MLSFYLSFGQSDKQTDRHKDRQTSVKRCVTYEKFVGFSPQLIREQFRRDLKSVSTMHPIASIVGHQYESKA